MNTRTINALRTANYESLVANGAQGSNHRARTIRTKRDKANDPRRQRKQRDWDRE